MTARQCLETDPEAINARNCTALCTQACSTAGMYGQAFAARLQHICDAVLEIEAVSDESDVVQLIPDPARYFGLR